MSADNGGWAFPNWTACDGMTLRDYFAAYAPQMPPALNEIAKLQERRDGKDTSDYGVYAKLLADWRWAYADAMLKARHSMSKAWHSGPPPSIGWWPASVNRHRGVLRWWNGSAWSDAAWSKFSLASVERSAYKRSTQGGIRWQHRPESWPARSKT